MILKHHLNLRIFLILLSILIMILSFHAFICLNITQQQKLCLIEEGNLMDIVKNTIYAIYSFPFRWKMKGSLKMALENEAWLSYIMTLVSCHMQVCIVEVLIPWYQIKCADIQFLCTLMWSGYLSNEDSFIWKLSRIYGNSCFTVEMKRR